MLFIRTELHWNTVGSLVVHLSRGLAPELEQLRTQDINPDEDSAAYRALKRITTPKEEHSPESTDDAAAAVDSRVKMKQKKKTKQRNIEGREIKQVRHYACMYHIPRPYVLYASCSCSYSSPLCSVCIIHQGHKQYELTYGMMLGMRVMVTAVFVACLHELTDSHITLPLLTDRTLRR